MLRLVWGEEEETITEEVTPKMIPKECLTCIFGEKPPEELGGRVFETDHWRIEHSVGPVPEGSMVLVSNKHIERLGQLDKAALEEYGKISSVLEEAIYRATGADLVYISK